MTDDEWKVLKEASEVSASKLIEAVKSLLTLGSSGGRNVGDQVVRRVIFDARNGTIKQPIYWLQAVITNA